MELRNQKLDSLICCKVSSVVSNSVTPGSSVHRYSPGKNIGVGCHLLFHPWSVYHIIPWVPELVKIWLCFFLLSTIFYVPWWLCIPYPSLLKGGRRKHACKGRKEAVCDSKTCGSAKAMNPGGATLVPATGMEFFSSLSHEMNFREEKL